MIRLQFAGEERPTPGLPIDSAEEGFWAGAMLCMASVAIATAVGSASLGAQQARAVANGQQDDPQYEITAAAIEDQRLEGMPLTAPAIRYDTQQRTWTAYLAGKVSAQDQADLIQSPGSIVADQMTGGFRLLFGGGPWQAPIFLQASTGPVNAYQVEEDTPPVYPAPQLWPTPPLQALQPFQGGQDEVVQEVAPLTVSEEGGFPFPRPEWDTVVSLWWDDTGPIEHVPAQEGEQPVLPVPSLWPVPPRLILWHTDEVVTPPPPLTVEESDWVNPVPPALWIVPPRGLVSTAPDEWPTPIIPLAPDEDRWAIPRPMAEPVVYQRLLLWETDETVTVAAPLTIEESDWVNPVAPRLWLVPPSGLVQNQADEWPTPVPLGVEEGEWRSLAPSGLWVLPPIGLYSLSGDEWPTPSAAATLRGLHIVDRTRSYLKIINRSMARYRVLATLRQGGRPVKDTLNPYDDLEMDFEVTNRAASDGHWQETTGLSPVAFLAPTPTGAAIGGATVALAARSGKPNRYYGTIDSAILQADVLPTYLDATVWVILSVPGDARRKMPLRVGSVGDFDA